jgi:very-short-patch-repair endonuclease
MNYSCKCGRNFLNDGAYQNHLKTCNGEVIDFDKIKQLYRSGLLVSQIMIQCNCTKNIVNFIIKDESKRSLSEIAIIAHKDVNRNKVKCGFGLNKTCDICGRSFNNGNFTRHVCLNGSLKTQNTIRETNEITNTIVKLYNDGQSLCDITKIYSRSIVRKVLHGKRRSRSEASRLAHKLKPENFKHSEISKGKMRQKRLEYFKNNPEAMTSWRQKGISYPEKIFQQLVQKNELTKKYDIVREYAFFPYFIDFAFVNIKLAVEIDGSQHWLKESKIKSDKEKDQVLMNNNWRVYRIPEFKLKKEFENTEEQFLKYLSIIEQQPKQFVFENEIIEYEKIKQQKKQQKRIKAAQYFSKLDNEFEKRKHEFDVIDKSRGYIGRLSKLWNVSHTQVRRYLENHKLLRT